MQKLAFAAARDGHPTMRFNYRGVGGSQGASRLNTAAEEAAGRLADRGDLQVIHQAGQGWGGAEGRQAPAGTQGALRYVRVSYLDRIGAAYACADLVVSRCGANALAEITACALPAILVPYPHAADDHQAQNATRLVSAGAAVLVADADLTGLVLTREIAAVFDRPGRLAAMAAAARHLGRPDAADRVAAEVVRLAAHP